jgi:hypothetical protein
MSNALTDIRLEVQNDKHSYMIDSTTGSIGIRASVVDMISMRRNLAPTNFTGTPIRLLMQLVARLQLSVTWAFGPFRIKLLKSGGPTFIARLVFFPSHLNDLAGHLNPKSYRNIEQQGERR